MSWTLTSNAAQLSQTLGLHRANTMEQDSSEQVQTKKLLFWTIYVFDKTLSLRLGRASTIQEYDIALGMPTEPQNPELRNWHLAFCIGVDVAAIHGDIYEKLYSPRAYTETHENRLRIVQQLTSRLELISLESQKVG